MSAEKDWCPLFGEIPKSSWMHRNTLIKNIWKMREIWGINITTTPESYNDEIRRNLAKDMYQNANDFILMLEESKKQNKILNKQFPQAMKSIEEQIDSEKIEIAPTNSPKDNEVYAILGLYALHIALNTRSTDWLERSENLCGKAGTHGETHKQIKIKAQKKQQSESGAIGGKGKLGKTKAFTELVERIISYIDKQETINKYDFSTISNALKFIGETLNGKEDIPDGLEDNEEELIELRLKHPPIDINHIYIIEENGVTYFSFSTHTNRTIKKYNYAIQGKSTDTKSLRETIRRIKNQ